MNTIPVLAAPLVDPAMGRVDIDVPDGMTLAQIIAIALPYITEAEWPTIRLSLVNGRGNQIIEQQYWRIVKPRQGVRVVIRIVPAGDALRSILSIVVAVAATALSGGTLAGSLAGALGIGKAAAGALITLGVTAVGNLAINALVPPPEPDKGPENSYTISGFKNKLDPDGAIPVPLGKIRYAPPFAAKPFNQIINDDQHIVSLFVLGFGPLNVSEMRLGESSLSEYDEVEIEVRDGLASDLPVSLMPRQVVEETVGTQLSRLRPRDDLGEVQENDPGIEKPIVRSSGSDASGACVLLAWAGGLGFVDNKGRKGSLTQDILIENRLAGADIWQDVTTLHVVGDDLESFYRQFSWDFPSRGKWEVRLTMLTDENTGDNVQQGAVWAAIQTLRPEYPINFPHPLSLVALRIKATDQINGQIDNFNAIVERTALDWDHLSQTWIERATDNPASHFRYILQSVANAKPVTDSGLDLEMIQDWHDFCRIKGLAYNKVLDTPQFSLKEALAEVAAAGRAAPRHDGVRWGVTIDRPSDLVVDHISARNAENFKVTRSYFERPDGFRVKFQDETNEHRDAERLVPWPGHVGDLELVELLQLPGKTSPTEIYREARRRAYELMYRPDVYEALQDGPARVATRGDLVMANHHVLDRLQVSARVTAVDGQIVSLDEDVSFAEETDYVLRFRHFAETQIGSEPDTVGTSVVREVLEFGAAHNTLTLKGEGVSPCVGHMVLFGTSVQVSKPLIVRGVEAAENSTSQIYLIDAAPVIDEIVDGEEIPAWSGRVGAEISENLIQPAAPIFRSVESGIAATQDADMVIFRIAGGPGIVLAAEFVVEHKLASDSEWTAFTIPAANAGGEISDYSAGDEINLRAKSVSETDVAGLYSAVLTLIVGADNADIPTALDDISFQVSGGVGAITVAFATGDSPATTSVQIYRSTTAVVNRETDAAGAPLAVSPNQTYSMNFGDATRTNLLSGLEWDLGTGWSALVAAVEKSAGTASEIFKTVSFEAGKHYRIGFEVANQTAGTLLPRLQGGSDRLGVGASANGVYIDRIQAVTGNNQLSLYADASFDGDVSDVVMIVETASCLDQGTHYIWIEPLNDDGVPGPMSGPTSIKVV